MARALLEKQLLNSTDIKNTLWMRQRIINSICDHSASLLHSSIGLGEEY